MGDPVTENLGAISIGKAGLRTSVKCIPMATGMLNATFQVGRKSVFAYVATFYALLQLFCMRCEIRPTNQITCIKSRCSGGDLLGVICRFLPMVEIILSVALGQCWRPFLHTWSL